VVSRTKRGQLLGDAFAVITLAVLVIPWVISLYQTPTYEASIKILVGQRSIGEPSFRLLAGDVSGVHAYHLQDLTLTAANVAETMPVARAVVEQLNLPELSAREVLQDMMAEPDPGTLFVNISYKDSDPKRAQLIANTIGQVVSEKASKVSVGTNAITATVWAPATLPKTPVSPNPVRNMLLALATWGLMLGLLITARASLGNPIRLPQKNVFPERSYTAGSLEGAKEQELLEALGSSASGELTAAGAALETSLTVEEADRMLFRLAAKGHLRVRASETGGGLFYSFWQRS
jgi:capsular polysaccharide biosynthesis protein